MLINYKSTTFWHIFYTKGTFLYDELFYIDFVIKMFCIETNFASLK